MKRNHQIEGLMQSYTVRLATAHDLPSIVAIHNQNARVACERFDQGFLLQPTTIADVEGAIAQKTQFLVAVAGGESVVGFVMVARPRIDGGLLGQVDWLDPQFAQLVEGENHRYIQVVAVDRGCLGQGVGQLLYGAMFERFRGLTTPRAKATGIPRRDYSTSELGLTH